MHKLAIVDFSTAKDLKEVGFDWYCDYNYYMKSNHKIFKQGELLYGATYNEMDWTSAPEQALVIKWLLDIHNLYVVIEPHFKQWFWEIRQINNTDSYAVYYIIKSQIYTNPNAYKTHDEAQLGGIKECIKYLKNETE